ncbi:MAG: DUF1801 domain-containing protein [Pseudobacteriovorax sp.]|nr:DUF1801 domain-containing protein [Pseudobacteriovorax sp.]
MSRHRISNPQVAAVFRAYPAKARQRLREIRGLIVDTATQMSEVGELEEVLKWGEPSYLTTVSKSGSTVRIDWKHRNPNHIAIYFKCTTDLVSLFKKRFKRELLFEGNRAIILSLDEDIPFEELQLCIGLALTYHRNKKLTDRARWSYIEADLARK